MSFWLWGALLAFLGGVAVGLCNYLLSLFVLRKKAEWFSFISVARQLLQVGYLVALFFAAPLTPWSQPVLLLGGALGITGSMFFFTGRLVKLNDAQKKQQTPPDQGGTKEE